MNIRVIDGKILHNGTIYDKGDIINDVDDKIAHDLVEIGVAGYEKEATTPDVEYEENEVFDCFTAPIADVKKLGKDLGLTFKRGMEETEIRQLVNDALAECEDVETGVEMPEEENGEMPNTEMPE